MILLVIIWNHSKIVNLQESREEAPICVVAPHATIVDSIVILMCYAVPVAKKSLSKVPLFGPIGRLMQVVFVGRERASQRNAALQAIKVKT